MAKVQQRALALFRLIAANDPGLHLDRAGHCLETPDRIARPDRRAFAFQPVKETRVAQQPVFHHFAVARQEVAVPESG